MKCKYKTIRKLICLLILASRLQFSLVVSGQALIISSGTNTTGSAGKIVLFGNLVNNGSFINRNNTIVLEGTSQEIRGIFPVAFNNLIIGSGSTATITTGGHSLKGILLCNGTLNANGNITLLSSDSHTALINGKGTGQVNGDIIMQRYLPSGFGYKYLSSPFRDATVGELADDMNLGEGFPTLYRYDENRTTSGWVAYTHPAGSLNPMHGYAVNMGESSEPRTIDIKGNVNNGEVSLTLFNHNNLYTKGFNLVGNPYPSPIDWNSPEGWTKINIDDALYYFISSTTDRYGGSYSTYMDGISSDGLATSIIPSMQGFFVHVSEGSFPVTGTLGTTNEVRITNQEYPFIKSDNKGSIPYLRMVAGYSDDSLSYDPLVIYFDIKATTNYDGQLDALKLFNTDLKVTNFYSFSDDGRRLSINSLPIRDENPFNVRLGIKTDRDGEVVFKIRDIVGDFLYKEISISDLVTGVEQNLLSGKQYKISLSAGHYQERFILNLSNNLTSISNHNDNNDNISIYSFNKALYVNIINSNPIDGYLSIFNLYGQVLYKYMINGPGEYQFNPVLRGGLYIICFSSDSMRVTKKLYFQH